MSATAGDGDAGSTLGLRMGIMGGSFDPVHQAHLALARSAMAHLHLDGVRWIPVGQAWQKSRQLAPAADRAAMVELAVSGEPGFVLDRIEIDRPGPSYTVETVRSLQRAHPEVGTWVLIIGQDQYNNLPTWQGWKELLQRVVLAVATRGPMQPLATAALRGQAHRMVHLPMDPLPVSSTEIRQRLAQALPPQSLVPALLPPSVAGYIAQNQLYAPSANR